MKKIMNTCHFIGIKSIIIFVLSVITIIVLLMFYIKGRNQQLEKKICGKWLIKTDKIIFLRKEKYSLLSNTFTIEGNSISWPIVDDSLKFCRTIDSLTTKKQAFDTITFFRRQLLQSINRSTGIWQCNKEGDSIIINTPSHPLNGIYSISFTIYRNSYLMILQNDSTVLICEKQFSPIEKRPHLDEWL